MKRDIYGHDKAYPEMAASLSNLALVYKGRGKLMELIQFREEGPTMERIISSPNKSHPFTPTSFTNLASVYIQFAQLQKAVVMHKQSLNMKRAIYGTDAM